MVLSPFGIGTVIALAFPGAKGITAAQIKNELAFPSEKTLLKGYKNLGAMFKSNGDTYTLNAANRAKRQ
jgi:serine protease inhibitor